MKISELREMIAYLDDDAEVPMNKETVAWQPAETAPKDGRQILVAVRGKSLPFWWKWTTFYNSDGQWDGNPPDIMFTRWIDLPDDPA